MDSDGAAAMQPDIRWHASGRCIVNDSDGGAAMQPDIRWQIVCLALMQLSALSSIIKYAS